MQAAVAADAFGERNDLFGFGNAAAVHSDIVFYKAMNGAACKLCGSFNFFVGSINFAVGDVLANATREEVNILCYHAHAVAQGVHCDIANVLTVNQNFARRCFIKARNE